MVETGRKGAAKKKVMKDFSMVEKLDVDIENIGDEINGMDNGAPVLYVFQEG